MKQGIEKAVSKIVLLIAAMLWHIAAFAQEKSMDINVDINDGNNTNWYSNPWAWIIGAAVFILLLVAIVRGGKTSD